MPPFFIVGSQIGGTAAKLFKALTAKPSFAAHRRPNPKGKRKTNVRLP